MKFFASLLLVLLSVLSPKACDGILWGSFCPSFQVRIAEKLGSQDCGCKGAFSIQYLLPSGTMQSCDYMYDGIETEIDLYQFRLNAVTEIFGDLEYQDGMFGSSQVRLIYKARLPSLFLGGRFNYEPVECLMAVFDQRCNSCTIGGEFPVPEFSYDCSNIVEPA